MFDSDNIKIRFDPRYVNSTPSNDFRISNKGTYVTFTSVKNQGAVSMSLSELLCSTDDFYYEAKMTGTNNSIAVGLISYEVYVYIGARFDEEFVGGDREVLESWSEGTRQWDVIVSDTWPSNHSYTYHGDTGEVWYNEIGSTAGVPLKIGDTVGWGIDGHKRQIFWTINGCKLEKSVALKHSTRFHPVIAFKGDDGQLELNFGKQPFVYAGKNAATPEVFPAPKTFYDEWRKEIGNDDELPRTLMFDNLCDVKLLSKENIEIKCHGIVLATRSPVLRAMMDPTNNGGDTIVIKDFDATTISKMLWFMYSDKVKPENIDMELLGISNMYQFEALQIVCEKHLSKELDPKNVMDAWMGAHLLEREIFLEVCEEFVISNWDEVQKTDSFKKSLSRES